MEGYDGLFLDTIGDVEWPIISPIREEQVDAATNLVRDIRQLYPEHLLIQNNGVEYLCDRATPWIDAICWENPLFVAPHLAWSQAVEMRLASLGQSPKGLRTLLLFEKGTESERSIQVAEQIARRHGWMISVADRDYL